MNDPTLWWYRAGCFALAVCCVIGGLWLFGQLEDEGDATYGAAQAAADDLERGNGPFAFVWDVEEAVNDESGRLSVSDKGSHRYEITTRAGKHPVCLTVKNDGRLFKRSVGVTYGRC